MSQPYVGEIRCFGFNFAPRDWAFCNGQILPIAQNSALFAVLGTTYGGDGITTYALPNLQGQVPMHWGTGQSGLNTTIGEVLGQTTVTLTVNQLAAHSHAIVAADPNQLTVKTAAPTTNSYISSGKGTFIYQKAPVTPGPQFSNKAITPSGNTQPHQNVQPFLAINICISLFGIFPSRN
ncbi:MAG: tail fiber protein [Pseudolabrys sp.]|nr:tail fiber protein [Pseudolabrys sp.]MDP2295534.1 tail fiber protein [Pseudolabrys sp.]